MNHQAELIQKIQHAFGVRGSDRSANVGLRAMCSDWRLDPGEGLSQSEFGESIIEELWEDHDIELNCSGQEAFEAFFAAAKDLMPRVTRPTWEFAHRRIARAGN
jgi:hypothetical protein